MKKLKVLIVEDNLHDYEAIVERLGKTRLTLSETQHSNCLQDARSQCQEKKFDVILMDNCLPDGSGIDALEDILQLSPESTIVFVTEDSDTEKSKRAIRLGAQDYLIKGHFDSELLERVINYSIDRHLLIKKLNSKEKDLRKSNEKLKAANQAKTDFLSNMSHEIRTPLNLIVGLSDLLCETELTDQQRKYVAAFQKSSNHLLNLINDILDISKIENQGLTLRNECFSFEDLIDSVVDVAAISCSSNKNNFAYYLDPAIENEVVGDPKCIRQLLLNIINNANKFTQRGRVELEVKLLFKDPLRHHQEILIRLADTGIGMSDKDRKLIFNKFTQGNNISAQNYGGTGLGLAISKAIIDKMNGSIEVQSKKGKGTTFSVRLPLRYSQVKKEKWRPSLLQGKQTVIASKCSLEIKNLRKHIEWLGGKIIKTLKTAEDTAEYLESSWANNDVIILDIQMAPTNLLDLLEGGKVQPSTIKKCILLFPPIHRKNDLERAHLLNVGSCIIKPLREHSLEAAILDRFGGTYKPLSYSAHTKLKTVDSPPLHLLVAEDDEENRYLMEEFLKKENIKIQFAEDGQKVIDYFKQQKFDMILMDIQMPELNGYEATQVIRAWERHKGFEKATPIIALSANAFWDNLDQAKKQNMNGFLTKPIKKDILITSIRKVHDSKNANSFYVCQHEEFIG